MTKAGVDRNAGGGIGGAGGATLPRPAGLGTDAVVAARGAPGESDSGAAGAVWADALCSVALCSVALAFGADLIAAGLAGGNGTWLDGWAAQICPAATTRTDTRVVSRIGVTSTNPPRHSPPAIPENLFGW
jgi:hypothetical protein